MKIRTGFVSNSSSSSFVVAFPHKPKDAEDVKKMLFGKQEWHYADCYSEKDADAPTLGIAKKVFSQVKEKATEEEIFDSIHNGWFKDFYQIYPGMVDCYDDPAFIALKYSNPNDRKKIEDITHKNSEENAKRAKDIANAFQYMYEEAYIVVMEFSDNEGDAVEEHSGIFERLPHIRTSYH